jgi:hypothetical protein
MDVAAGAGAVGAVRSPGADLDDIGLHAAGELRSRYRAYRRRQAARLLDLVPPGAVRPLYRAALEAADLSAAGDARDPLTLLLEFCERLLPLPSLEAWSDDLTRHPEAHLEDLSDSIHGPSPDAPATLAARTLPWGGRSWRVRLVGYPSHGGWRGLLVFHGPAGALHRTTTVFHEADAVGLRDRFRSFEPGALRAFLRSALP